MLVFGIAFGKLLVSMLTTRLSFQGAFRGHFAQMLQNPKNATLSSEKLGLGVLGVSFCIIFANFLNVFFMSLSSIHFARFWQSWGSKGVPFRVNFYRF